MDPLSIACSIATLIQVSSDVLKYIITAKGASKDRKRLSEQILACEFVLLQFQHFTDNEDETPMWAEKLKPLEVPDKSLYRLRVALEAIKAKLEPTKGLEKAFFTLKWPFTEKDVEKHISSIQSEMSLLQMALNTDCSKITRELYRGQVNRDNQVILDWLTPIDHALQQIDCISRRQEGTGQWLLDSDEFKEWMEADNQTLFCPGIPGAGKTILTSIVVDYLYGNYQQDGSVGIAYLYCDFRRKDQQKPEDLIANLLKQLAQGRPFLPQNVKSLYDSHKGKRTRPSLGTISKTLQSVAATYSKVFIIVDALDECQETGGYRAIFLSELFNLQAECKVNLFATSRFAPEIAGCFKDSISLEIRASEQDVRRYVDSRISQLPSFVRNSLDLQEEIKAAIADAVDGMFLLAQLHLYSLTGKRSPKAVRTALRNLPTGSNAYDDAYRDVMDRIEGQAPGQVELAKQVLSWITCAKRPLTTSELQHALAVEADEEKLDQDNFTQIEDMVLVCAGLVTVNEESGIIRLVHYTAQEYFERTQKQWFPDAMAEIAEICVTYLSFSIFEDGPCQSDAEFEESLMSNQLYEYASRNWGHYARGTPAETKRLTLDFLQTESKVSRSSQALLAAKANRYRGYSQDVPGQVTGVHLAACFGLRDSIVALLKNGNEPDLKDTHGRTPLSYAVERGYEEVVALLLANEGVDPDSTDSALGWTPLWYAVAGGQLAVVRLLLGKPVVDPDSQSKYGRTPLSLAAEKGHAAIAELLLQVDRVDPNFRDFEYGWTPLSWAAANGHDVIVKLLLDKAGVDPNPKDFEFGRTPLSWAAERGHRAAVKILLEKDSTDPVSRSKFGRTPLWFARARGHEGIVELLMANDPDDPNLERFQYGQMPLWYAAENGQEAMVKALLRDGADPNSKSSYGRTPLSYAAERGHEGIAKLLLENDNVDPDSQDSEYGRTPLSWAASNGHVAIVKLLLEQKGVKPDSKSKNGRTPLSWAARFGHKAIVKLLLMRDDVDPNSKSNRERTPLSYAAERGHDAVVRLLVARDGVELSSKDSEYGRTPLLWAKANGHEAIVTLLSDKADMYS